MRGRRFRRTAGAVGRHVGLAQRIGWAMFPQDRHAGAVMVPDIPEVTWLNTRRGEVGVRIIRGPEDVSPVVMIHGVTWNSAINFHALVGPISATRTVVLLDLRGHGVGLPADAPFTMLDLAQDVLAVLDALEISRATIVGFSLGTMTALQVAAVRPDRVAGLVLTAGTLALARSKAEARVVGGAVSLLRCAVTAGLVDSFGARYFQWTERRHYPQFDRLWPWFQSEIKANDPHSVLRAMTAAMDHDVLAHKAALARIPSIVVIPTRDLVVPVAAQYAMARALAAPVIRLRADHEAPLSHPNEYRDAVVKALSMLPGA